MNTDTDTSIADTNTDDLDCDLPSELTDASRIDNYIEIAGRELDAEALSAAVIEHRGYMREEGIGDAMAAAGARWGTLPRVIDRAAVVYAAVHIREEGRVDLAAAPTIDSIGGDVKPTQAKKGKPKKGPKKAKRVIRWLNSVGTATVAFRAGFGVSDELLVELLKADWFRWQKDQVRAEACYGWCDLDDALQTEPPVELPRLARDSDWVCWGLRVDNKAKACPTKRLEMEAARLALIEARAKGYEAPLAAAVTERMESLRSAWYAGATPSTAVVPVSYHRPSWTFVVHSSQGDVIDAVVRYLSGTLGSVPRVLSALAGATDLGTIKPVRLADPDLVGEDLDLGVDLHLWLIARAQAGVARIDRGGDLGSIDWWPEDGLELVRASGGEDKRLTVRLSGSPESGGSLVAALADGCSPRRGVYGVRYTTASGAERTVKVTLHGGEAVNFRLQTEIKPDGTQEGTDAALVERLGLHLEATAVVRELEETFLTERRDNGSFRQRLTALKRGIGIVMVERWGVKADGQGYLFRDMLPGEQTSLGQAMEIAKDAKVTKARSKRGGQNASATT